ncbi:MAG: alanine racemase [Reichenbachiella sp.]
MSTKKAYIRPTLVKQQVGHLNKFGSSQNLGHQSDIESVPVKDLVEQFGSPLFTFSEKGIREQYRTISSAFKNRYPNVQFSWSYKTNYLDSICSVFHQEGSIAEVVSGFEYEKARSLGVPGNQIIFNGPYKSDSDLERAFNEGAIVNLDNFDEIYQAEKVAAKIDKQVKIGLRLNMDTGIKPHWHKFGFNLDNEQASDAVKRIVSCRHLNLSGLHSHIGTFVLDPTAYGVQIKKMVAFMQTIESKYETVIKYLDIGGGFPSKNRLKGIYLPPDVAIPEIESYADEICSSLLEALPEGHYPKLYLETGRAMIDEAGSLISTVLSRKNTPEGLDGYIVDAGVNLLYTHTWYNFNIKPDRPLGGIAENVKLYGPLCMNIDVIADSVYLPPMPVGTHLVIAPVGAYSVTQWMQFITYRPAVVMMMENGTVECIRRKEVLKDVSGCERIPESLKFDGISV